MIDTKAIRNKILDLAVRGKLTEQLPEDGTAEELYRQIQAEKQTLIKAGKIKKEKPLPEINEGDIPFEIPKKWMWVRIGTVLTLQAGKNMTASEIKAVQDSNHIIPCYGGNGQRGFVNQANIDGFHAIIGRQGALCGNINFAEGPFYATEHAVVVYGYAGTDMKWAGITLRYLNLNQYATSVAQPGLAVSTIDNVLIPLPSLAEQKRIVEKIEQAFSVLDTIDELQKKYADNRTVLKSKLIDLAIRGKLTEQLPEDGTAEELYQQIQAEKQALIKAGKIKKEKPLPEIDENEIPFEIPNNWKWVRLADIASTNIGLTYHPEDIVPDGTVVVRSSNIIQSKMDYTDLVKVKCPIGDNQYLNNNDIVICARNGSKALVGKCAIYEGKSGMVSFGAFMAVLRTPFYKYVFYYLLTNAFRRYFHSDDSKQINQVTQNILKEAIIPLPPLIEQNRIVERLDKLLAVCDELK